MSLGSHRLAVLALIITALLWSTGGVLIKTVPLSGLAVAGIRSLLASIVILALLRDIRLPKTLLDYTSIVCYAGTVILFCVATKRTTAANAILLQYMAPIWVLVLNRIFYEHKLEKADVVAVGLVLTGLCIFLFDSLGGGSMLGNILAVASGITFAGLAVSLKAHKTNFSVQSVLWGNILTALVCVFWIIPEIHTAWPFMMQSPQETVLPLVLLGVFQLGISYVLYTWAIKHVTALEAVFITMLEPLINPILVATITGETPSVTAIIGGCIVLAAVTYRILRNVTTV